MGNKPMQNPTAERITQWCEWFDLEMPALRKSNGGILLTNELMDWMRMSGASFDWIFSGDAKGMAIAYREKHKGQENALKLFSGLDEIEQKILVQALEAGRGVEGEAFQLILDQCKRDIDAYRSEKSAA